MFRMNRKPAPVVTAQQQDRIIKDYLEQIALAYKDQDISAERMIQMELELIAKRNA